MLADDKNDFLGGILCNVSCVYSYDVFIQHVLSLRVPDVD